MGLQNLPQKRSNYMESLELPFHIGNDRNRSQRLTYIFYNWDLGQSKIREGWRETTGPGKKGLIFVGMGKGQAGRLGL